MLVSGWRKPAVELVADEPEVPGSRGTILVVDDDADLREALRIKLERSGYEAVEAIDGPAALAAVDSRPIDLVLLDVTMPLMSGYEVCRVLRAGERTADLPVIMLTAHADATAATMGILAGADVYLGMPIGLGEVVGHVSALLARRRAAVAAAHPGAGVPAVPAPRRGLFGRGRGVR